MDKNNNRYGFISRRLAMAAATLAALAPALPASAAAGPERSLAGIAIFAPGSEVTHKFGNPSQILVGGVAPLSGIAGAAGGPGASGGSPGSAPGGFPGSSGGFPGSSSSSSGTGLLPGFPGVSSGGFPGSAPGGFPGASSGGFPGSSGGGFPGASGGGFPGAPGGASGFPGGTATAVPVKPPVTLVYNRANGGSLEFTISPDKRVVQVRETGYSGTYATSRGIKLGMPYSTVIAKYGYPEDTTIAGPIINIDYKDTLHCGFQFLDQRLVGIIVASPD